MQTPAICSYGDACGLSSRFASTPTAELTRPGTPAQGCHTPAAYCRPADWGSCNTARPSWLSTASQAGG